MRRTGLARRRRGSIPRGAAETQGEGEGQAAQIPAAAKKPAVKSTKRTPGRRMNTTYASGASCASRTAVSTTCAAAAVGGQRRRRLRDERVHGDIGRLAARLDRAPAVDGRGGVDRAGHERRDRDLHPGVVAAAAERVHGPGSDVRDRRQRIEARQHPARRAVGHLARARLRRWPGRTERTPRCDRKHGNAHATSIRAVRRVGTFPSHHEAGVAELVRRQAGADAARDRARAGERRGANADSRSKWLSPGTWRPLTRPSTTCGRFVASRRSVATPWPASPPDGLERAHDGRADRDDAPAARRVAAISAVVSAGIS